LGICALALSVLTGCFMPRSAGEHLQTEMLALRHDVGTLERRLSDGSAKQTEDILALRTQVLAMGKDVDGLTRASRVADADMGSQLERMVQDVQQLRGAIEDNAHLLGETSKEQSKLTQELTARIAHLQAKDAAPSRERTSPKAQSSMPTGKKELLAYGLNLMATPATREDGRGVLREVSRKFGKERSVGDEALYALGTSYFDEKKYDVALRDLIKMVDLQPRSARVAEAYFKIASCSQALGRLDDAQTFFAEVVNNHKRSSVFKAAKAQLDLLSRSQRAATAPSGAVKKP
jgi:TolA-binding protein